jgi:hypothetical protein
MCCNRYGVQLRVANEASFYGVFYTLWNEDLSSQVFFSESLQETKFLSINFSPVLTADFRLSFNALSFSPGWEISFHFICFMQTYTTPYFSTMA